MIVQGDLTVYGKIYSADAAVNGLPTTVPTASPTLAPTVLRDPDQYLYMREWGEGLLVGCFEPNARPIWTGGVPKDFAVWSG